jgi:tetratricopeptide (TPR) repeat protein
MKPNLDRDDASAGLFNAAVAAQEAADYLTLARIARKLIALSETNGDRKGLAWGHYFAGAAHFQRNDGRPAERSYRKALELFKADGDRDGIARSTLGLAAVAVDCDLDGPLARELYEEAIPIVRSLGDRRRLAIALGNFAEVMRLEGDARGALKNAEEALSIFREIDDAASTGWQLTNIAHFQLLRRDYGSAIESMHEAYAQLSRNTSVRKLALYFDVWFIILASLQQWDLAAKVLGFTNFYRDRNNAPRMQGIMPWFSRPVERLSENLAADRLTELMVEGETVTIAQLVSALQTVSE